MSSKQRAALIALVAALRDIEDSTANVSPERGEGFQVAGNIAQDVWVQVQEALGEVANG